MVHQIALCFSRYRKSLFSDGLLYWRFVAFFRLGYPDYIQFVLGDFLTLLSKYDDTLPEDMCRFYATQMILGMEFHFQNSIKYFHVS